MMRPARKEPAGKCRTVYLLFIFHGHFDFTHGETIAAGAAHARQTGGSG